jgi:hypothetical protein
VTKGGGPSRSDAMAEHGESVANAVADEEDGDGRFDASLIYDGINDAINGGGGGDKNKK